MKLYSISEKLAIQCIRHSLKLFTSYQFFLPSLNLKREPYFKKKSLPFSVRSTDFVLPFLVSSR